MLSCFKYVFKEAGSIALRLAKHTLLYATESLCSLVQSNSVAHH